MAGAAPMSPDAKIFHELWQSAERELNERPTARARFEDIIRSLNYDGTDTNSLTVGEIRRALPCPIDQAGKGDENDPDEAAKALVHRFEMESMALHRIQREWLEREIAKLLTTAIL
jgi:hypothetical protein